MQKLNGLFEVLGNIALILINRGYVFIIRHKTFRMFELVPLRATKNSLNLEFFIIHILLFNVVGLDAA